ncbi:MAG: MFS transporter [Shimia sp.]|nr:MFS transporter [Shimia sp.]
MTTVEQAAAGSARPLAGHRSALILLLLAYTLSITDRMILSVLFTPIKAEFGLSDTQLGLLGGLAFAIFYATLGIPVARLADRGNRKLIIVLSLFIFSVFTVLCGFAVGLVTLILFRIGVGIGEAGVNPSSQSIVADYYPAEKRSSAMAILMLGANIGMIFGFIVGGAISEHYGWRVALMAVGAPGILLTFFVMAFLKEPPRGTFENEARTAPPPVGETFSRLWHTPATRFLVFAITLQSMLGYGLAQWLPSFFMRTHGIAETQAGAIMGLVLGVAGILGAITGGKLCDRAAQRGTHEIPRLLGKVTLIAVPILAIAFQIPHLVASLPVFFLPIFLINFYLGPSLGLVQTLSPVRMRAVSAALVMLSMNLIGLGLGPVLIGATSDLLEPAFPGHGLAIALSIAALTGLISAYFFRRSANAMAASSAD